MKSTEEFVLLRIMYSHNAFGKSGNLTTDIIGLCRNMECDVFVYESAAGYNVMSEPARNYLFGATRGGRPNMTEVVLKSKNLQAFKTSVIELLENGKDNAAFYTIPLEGVVFNPDRIPD